VATFSTVMILHVLLNKGII